ncbi:MAG: T9SS type A sorting domain-containing protein, partial [Ignavibacteriaceae bacterium]
HWYVTSFNLDLRFDVEVERVDAGPVYVPVFSGSTTTSQFYLEVGTQLEAGEQYRWRVRTTKTGFPASDWSDYAFFTMDEFTIGAPVQPTPLYPVNNATVYTGTPTLHWYITSYIPGVQWDIRVQGVSAPVSGYDQTYSSTSYQYYFEWPDELAAGEDYRWQVRSKRSGYSNSDWSSWAAFNVYEFINGVPVKPTPVWPVGNATVYVNPPLLSWYVTPYVPGILYEVEVKSFATPFDETGTFLTGSYQQFYQLLSALTPGGHYHWRVRSYVGASFSAWSDEADFTIDANNAIGSVPQPQLVYPTGGISVFTTKPILSWYVNSLLNVTDFDVIVATDPGLTFQVPGSPFTVTNMHYHFTADLTPGTTYYWRVLTNGSVASLDGHFTIEPGSSAPVVPSIGGPNGINLHTTSAKLSWFLPVQAEAELSYEVEYSTSKDFSQSTKVDGITASSYTATNLQAGKEYYWRVKSVTKDNQSSGYSYSGSFVPAGVTDVEETIAIPEKFEVTQNYPNPFNPETNIRVNLPEAGVLSVKIFDILGQEVVTLINREMNAGVHTLQWKGENSFGQKVPSGTYIYRVSAGDNTQTMKMVLLK